MQYLKNAWKFIRENLENTDILQYAYKKDFDDSDWKEVCVPHDYGIEGPFSPEYDVQFQEVIADGILKPIPHIGRTGGLPFTDHAWYRKSFTVSQDCKNIFFEFDGIMSNSTIYINGTKCNERPYGYSSFSIDVSDYVIRGTENIIAISIKPENSSSRWYPGAGIYRNARYIEKDDVYFPYMPFYIVPNVQGKDANVVCEIDVVNNEKEYQIHCTIYDQNKNAVAQSIIKSKQAKIKDTLTIENYNKWHVCKSYLYTFEANIYVDDKLMDTYSTDFGVRTIEFNKDNGFYLNGENLKVRGVCLHHDEGALGAIVNKSVIERKLKKLIEMGTNAVRTSHNPPSPEFLDACDKLGVLVMDEAFDNWKIQKTDNNYGKYFDQWSEKDLSDMIIRDRNHPCIFMWSIGNEILEQRVPDGYKVARYLNNICKKLDPSRHTTAGFNDPINALKNGLWKEVDLIGINYKPFWYEKFHKENPDAILYGSETASCVSSRGEYYLNTNIVHTDELTHKKSILRDNKQCGSYDNEGLPWSCPPDREFLAQKSCDYIFGEFVWTGWDYLGEPSPYREEWPSRSSYFGIVDLCGIEKDRFYSYKSYWAKDTSDTLHLFPHWNWNEGDLIEVNAYSNYDEIELFLNGKSLGISTLKTDGSVFESHRHMWHNVPFEKGELKAVAVAKPSLTHIIKTADYPTNILITPEKAEICADGEEIVYIKCTAVDKNGVTCPKANFRLDFDITGAGKYLASDNGNPTDTRIFSKKHCNLFNGHCMIILTSIKDKIGEIKITASSDETGSTSVIINSI